MVISGYSDIKTNHIHVGKHINNIFIYIYKYITVFILKLLIQWLFSKRLHILLKASVKK